MIAIPLFLSSELLIPEIKMTNVTDSNSTIDFYSNTTLHSNTTVYSSTTNIPKSFTSVVAINITDLLNTTTSIPDHLKPTSPAEEYWE